MTNGQQLRSRQEARKRGRPTKSDDEVEAKRRHIAETAQRLFQDEGYGQVSMRRLAKEIGCSPMTLYKYYDGKIAILQTLWAVVFQDVFNEIESSLEGTSSARERLKIACLEYVGYWIRHPEHYRLVFMAEGVTQPEVSMFIGNPAVESGFRVLGNTISAAATGSPNAALLKIKIDLTISMLHGIAHNLITISGYAWSDVEAMIDHYAENVI